MAKDPAFLFYPGDWLQGTMGMTFEEQGAYLQLLIFQFNKGPFSEDSAKRFLRENPSLWNEIKNKFKKNDAGLYFNQRLLEEQSKRQNYTESRRQSRTKSDEDNVRIYIVRDNVRLTYKIGSSVNPVRRYNELANQKNPAIMEDEQGERNISLIWYSDAVERKEESKLHKHFSSKNLNGEWFSLTEIDLKFIYSKYSGTMYRTSNRTENENENRNENRNEILIEYETWTQQIVEGNDQHFEQMFMKEAIPQSPNIQFWIYDHRDLLNRYPKMRPPNQQAFRQSCIKHIRENYKKEPNGKVNGNSKQDQVRSAAEYVANHYGNKPK